MANQPLQDIKTEADYITAAQALPQDHLGSAFGGGDDFEEYTKAQQTIKQIAENASDIAQLSGSNEGLILTGAATVIKGLKEQGDGKNSKKKSMGSDTTTLMLLLDQLEALNDRINDNLRSLEDMFGEDVIGGMAETYLPPEILAECETDAQKMQALMGHMLDEDGNIKPEFANIDPRIIDVLEGRHDAQEVAGEINREYENNGGEPTPRAEALTSIYVGEHSTAEEYAATEALDNRQARNIMAETDIQENIEDRRTDTGFTP